MKNQNLLLLLLLACITIHTSYGQSTGDYKSNGTGGGNWNAAATWLVYDGTNFTPALTTPHNTASNIIIQGGDVVTLTSTETLTQLTVNSTGTLTVASGQTTTLGGSVTVDGTMNVLGTLVCSTYTIAGSGSFLLKSGATLDIGSPAGITASGATGNIQTTTRSFNTGANYIYSGTAAQVTGNGLPASGITGTITVNNTNTATGLTLSQSVGLTSPGAVVVPSGSVLTCAATTNITGSGSFTLNSGGTLIIGSAAGISTTAGTGNIQVTGTKTFSAAANYTYNASAVQSTGNALPSPLTGTLTIANTNLSGCSLANSIVVNAPGLVTVTGTGNLTCPANIVISGTGTFTLNTNSTLLIGHAKGISADGLTGNIQTAVINYNPNANYIYYGSVAQITGTGLPSSINQFYINNTGGVTLTNSVTANALTTLNAGQLCLNGNTLYIANGKSITRKDGTIALCSGNIVFLGTVNLTYSGTANTTPGPEMPSSSTAINNLTIAMSAGKSLNLNSSLTVNGIMTMTSGSILLNGYTLTYAPTTTLVYNGTAAQTVGEEWPNTGLSNNITVKNTYGTSGVVLNANKSNYTGTLTVSSTGYFNSGAYTLNGTGNITVSTGGTFITPNTSGVSPAGAIQLTGNRTFASGSSYTFNGTAAQVTGLEMPALVTNLTVNNTAATTPVVTLLNNGTGTLTVTGTLALTAGVFDLNTNSMSLTFQSANTPVSRSTGSLTVNPNTSLQFGTAGNTGGNAFTLPNDLFTTVSPLFTNLIINRTNSLKLNNQNITLNGSLTLTAGVLDMASTTLSFQNGNTPISVTAGTLTAGTTASLQFGTAGNTGGNAFTLPNNLFTTAPSLLNLTVNRINALTLGTQNITTTGTLTLTNGTLNIGSSTLGINGTVSVTNGILNGGPTSNIAIGGSGTSLTLPAVNVLNNLTIARPNISAVPAVNLSDSLTIEGTLNLSGGSLSLGTNNLTLDTAATIINYNASRYIVTNNNAATGGYLTGNAGSTPVTFPVGTTTFTPAIVDNTSGTADNFRVRVFDGILSNGLSGTAYVNSINCVNKTWLVEEAIAGGSNVNLTLQWNTADENASFSRDNSSVSHYTNGAWEQGSKAAQTLVSAGIYTQSRSGITSFSPFSVEGGNTVVTTLPVKWLSFKAQQKEKTVRLDWTTANEQNNNRFEIERWTTNADHIIIGSVKGSGTFAAQKDYIFVDETPLLRQVSYYRLKQVDNDGRFMYSSVCAIRPNDAASLTLEVYPVPAITQLTVVVVSPSDAAAKMVITNMQGQQLKQQAVQLAKGRQAIRFNVSDLPKGIYLIKLLSNTTTYEGKWMK